MGTLEEAWMLGRNGSILMLIPPISMLTIVVVGLIVLAIAFIFQIIAFFSIGESAQPIGAQPSPVLPVTPSGGRNSVPIAVLKLVPIAVLKLYPRPYSVLSEGPTACLACMPHASGGSLHGFAPSSLTVLVR